MFCLFINTTVSSEVKIPSKNKQTVVSLVPPYRVGKVCLVAQEGRQKGEWHRSVILVPFQSPDIGNE